MSADEERFPWDEVGERLTDTLSPLLGLVRALRQDAENYALLWQGRKDRTVTALALDVGTYFDRVTRRLRGTVCFSATMDPLPEMRRLLGGNEEDACFSMPSPYPPEHLLLLQRDVDTRYHSRPASAAAIAAAIERMAAHPGRYLAFFPSFAMLRMVSDQLTIPHQVQLPKMTQEERDEFLAPYFRAEEPVLSLCVLGGIFAEGIDLPGTCLDGVCIAGVGLPQVNLFRETLRDWYQQQLGDGFLYAYRLPGMQKVAQAVGRVIRSETDRGIALLLDDRYRRSDWQRLFPAHWQVRWNGSDEEMERFW